MTRKDYEFIAKSIAEMINNEPSISVQVANKVIEFWSNELKKQNERFNQVRFESYL
jgi:hypothetical protein